MCSGKALALLCELYCMLSVKVDRIGFDVMFNTKSYSRITKASTKTNSLILCMVCDNTPCYAISVVK